jgi:hypothetical protein
MGMLSTAKLAAKRAALRGFPKSTRDLLPFNANDGAPKNTFLALKARGARASAAGHEDNNGDGKYYELKSLFISLTKIFQVRPVLCHIHLSHKLQQSRFCQ